MIHFYSRPCGRGDRLCTLSKTYLYHFYSRPCGRGDVGRGAVRIQLYNFYSRPCGRGDGKGIRAHERNRHFYSRPCGRGDPLPGLYCENTLISTHAPAGGATICAIVVRDSLPAFLLTPLREGRHKFHPFPVRLFRISTHAPAGGATGTGKEALTSEGNFYSRPCGRGDGSMIPGRNACL